MLEFSLAVTAVLAHYLFIMLTTATFIQAFQYRLNAKFAIKINKWMLKTFQTTLFHSFNRKIHFQPGFIKMHTF